MISSYLAFALCFIAAASHDWMPSPVTAQSRLGRDENRTMDPVTDPDWGRLVHSSRAVLKLDCQGCPVNASWGENTTALIYDITLTSITNPQPVLLNGGPFFPPGPFLGWTPFTKHRALPVPNSTTVSNYLSNPDLHPTVELVGWVLDQPVSNNRGWNITLLTFITEAYGDCKNGSYQNYPGGNISLVNVYLMAHSKSVRTIEWYEIAPMAYYLNNGTGDLFAPKVPKRLAEKLTGRSDEATKAPGRTRGRAVSYAFLITTAMFCLFGVIGILVRRFRAGARRGIYLRGPERTFGDGAIDVSEACK